MAQLSRDVWIVPQWLNESIISILSSFYPFAILFFALNAMFFDPGEKREAGVYDHGQVIHWGFMFCVVVHFYLLFGVGLSLFMAFGLAVGTCIVLPISGYRIFRPMVLRHAETERMSPREVAAIAQHNKPFAHFLQSSPSARVFVTDTEHRYRFARVCALHRYPRPEDPGVVQDTVFEVQVDMRRKRVVEETEVFQTYLYRAEEEGYCALVLPLHWDDWRPGEPRNIDKATLEQLGTVPSRFPRLDRYPLPIASRGREAVEVAVEKADEG